MKASKYICIAVLAAAMTACSYTQPDADKLYLTEDQVSELTKDGKVYDLHELMDAFMTEKGNYLSDTTFYRTRANDESTNPGIWLFSIDTLPSDGPDIYIRGRVSTDDNGGNFYKAMVIQQIVGGKQQNLRISIDQGSASGMYPRGQEILIRCNGLALGRYANQVQLCVPSYNNNTSAHSAEQKIGWAPGRIPAPLIKKHFKLIGTPDAGKLQYDVMTIADIVGTNDDSHTDIKGARKIDGRLVKIENVWFDGNYKPQSDSPTRCNAYLPDASGKDSIGNPEEDTNAAVFGPTTGNVGFPQSRCITDASGKWTLVSTSEYAKYAHFYLPYEVVDGNIVYGTFRGEVRGILSYYMDNAGYAADQSKWAISLCGKEDIDLEADGTGVAPKGTKWEGKWQREWQRNTYQNTSFE